jgi:hypothetical protein
MNLENDAYFGENDSSLLNSSFANDSRGAATVWQNERFFDRVDGRIRSV